MSGKRSWRRIQKGFGKEHLEVATKQRLQNQIYFFWSIFYFEFFFDFIALKCFSSKNKKVRVFTKQRAGPGNDLQPFLFCKNLNFSQLIKKFPFSYVGRSNNLKPYTIEIVYPRPSGFAIYYVAHL